jgi:hypothetical protein
MYIMFAYKKFTYLSGLNRGLIAVSSIVVLL